MPAPNFTEHSVTGRFATYGPKAYDYYPSPPDVALGLLAAEAFWLRDAPLIWECACGSGAISVILEKAGLEVRSTDLIAPCYGLGGVDFLTCPDTAPVILTNPPLSLHLEFIEHAVQQATYMAAMFLPLRYLETIKRSRLMRRTGLTRVHVYEYRVPFVVDNIPRNLKAYAWYIWDKTAPYYELKTGIWQGDWITHDSVKRIAKLLEVDLVSGLSA